LGLAIAEASKASAFILHAVIATSPKILAVVVAVSRLRSSGGFRVAG